MAAAGALAAEGHGPFGRQLAVDEVHPRRIAVVPAVAVLYAAVVAEAVLQRVGDGFAVGRRTAVGAQPVDHLQRRAAVAHQRGHSLLLFRCAGEIALAGFRVHGRIVGYHLVPGEGGGIKAADGQFVGVLVFVLRTRGVAVDGRAGLFGPLVIVHQLCHGGGHTARHRPGAVNRRTQVVVRPALVPVRLDERRDVFRGGSTWRPRPVVHLVPAVPVVLQPGYLLGIALQPCPHVVGQIVGVDAATLAKAEDRHGLVIVRDDDKATAAHVEHVETTHLARRLHGRGRLSLVVARHELLCLFQCLFRCHLIGPGTHANRSEDQRHGCPRGVSDCLKDVFHYFYLFNVMYLSLLSSGGRGATTCAVGGLTRCPLFR